MTQPWLGEPRLYDVERGSSILLRVHRQGIECAALCESKDMVLKFPTVMHGTDEQTLSEDDAVLVVMYKISVPDEFQSPYPYKFPGTEQRPRSSRRMFAGALMSTMYMT